MGERGKKIKGRGRRGEEREEERKETLFCSSFFVA
jgi:hypothetical protein